MIIALVINQSINNNTSLQNRIKAPAPTAQNLPGNISPKEERQKYQRETGNISLRSTRRLEVNVIFSPIICTLILHETIFHTQKSLCSLVFEKEKELEIGPISFRKVGFFSFWLAFFMTLYTRRQIINIMIYTEKRAVRIMAQTVLSFIMLP